MARIQASALVGDIRGKLNGSVFQGTQGGTIIRNNNKGKSVKSIQQQIQNAALNTVQYTWSQLTQAQRDQWNAMAQFAPQRQYNSPTRFLNGHQLFIRSNTVRLQAGLAIVLTPTFIPAPFIMPSFTASNPGTFLEINYAGYTVPIAYSAFLQISAPLPHTVFNSPAALKGMRWNTKASTWTRYSSFYTDLFGILPIAGQRISFIFNLIDTNSHWVLRSAKVNIPVA